MKTKQVFPTDEIAHIWINERQQSARNSAGNLSFSGRSLYSYSTIVAEMYRENKNVVFITNRTYSNTTSKQMSLVRRSIPSYKTEIYCSYPAEIALHNENFYRNIEAYYNEALNYLKEAQKPRKQAKTINELQHKAVEELTKIENFLKVFDLTIETLKHKETISYGAVLEKSEFKAIVEAVKNKALILEGNKEIIEANQKAIDKADKDKKARIKKANLKAEKEAQELLQFWLTDSPDKKGRLVDTYRLSALSKIYLRAIPQDKAVQVQSSQGARVDIKKAKTLFKALQAKKDVLGFDLDGYKVVEKTDDHLKIGCHVLEFTEINRFATSQGW